MVVLKVSWCCITCSRHRRMAFFGRERGARAWALARLQRLDCGPFVTSVLGRGSYL
jgi:hypothetical protein